MQYACQVGWKCDTAGAGLGAVDGAGECAVGAITAGVCGEGSIDGRSASGAVGGTTTFCAGVNAGIATGVRAGCCVAVATTGGALMIQFGRMYQPGSAAEKIGSTRRLAAPRNKTRCRAAAEARFIAPTANSVSSRTAAPFSALSASTRNRAGLIAERRSHTVENHMIKPLSAWPVRSDRIDAAILPG
jgi:hypothetical protein